MSEQKETAKQSDGLKVEIQMARDDPKETCNSFFNHIWRLFDEVEKEKATKEHVRKIVHYFSIAWLLSFLLMFLILLKIFS